MGVVVPAHQGEAAAAVQQPVQAGIRHAASCVLRPAPAGSPRGTGCRARRHARRVRCCPPDAARPGVRRRARSAHGSRAGTRRRPARRPDRGCASAARRRASGPRSRHRSGPRSSRIRARAEPARRAAARRWRRRWRARYRRHVAGRCCRPRPASRPRAHRRAAAPVRGRAHSAQCRCGPAAGSGRSSRSRHAGPAAPASRALRSCGPLAERVRSTIPRGDAGRLGSGPACLRGLRMPHAGALARAFTWAAAADGSGCRCRRRWPRRARGRPARRARPAR